MRTLYKGFIISVLFSAMSLFETVEAAAQDGKPAARFASDSVAIEDTTSTYLTEINVLSSRVPIVWHKQARMVTTINTEAVQATPSQSINDVLKYSASVDVRQRGPIGAQTDIGIRGGSSEQAAILLNGINISDPQTSHNSFDLPLNMLQIDGIDILEGPSGKITGSSSLMGAINVRTHISNVNAFSANVETGSYGYLNAGVRFDYAGADRFRKNINNYFSVPRLKNSISASYTRSDGYSRSANSHLNMDYKTLKAYYEGQYQDENMEVRWFAGLSSKDWGSNRFYAKYDEQFEHTFKTFAAVKARNVRGILKVNPSVYWNHTNDRFELFRNNPDAYPFNYHKTNVYGVNLNNYFEWKAGITAFGGEIRNEDLLSGNLGEPLDKPRHIKGTDRYYDHGLNRTNTSLFLEHNIIKEKYTVSAAMLAIKNSWAKMDMKVYPSADLSMLIYQKGFHFLRLYASYNSSLRMPSVTELYYSVGGHKADSHLKPEEVDAFEMGLKYNKSYFSSSLSLFNNRMTNLIDWVRNTADGEDAVWRSVNFGRVNSSGMLVQASYRPWRHFKTFSFKGVGFSYSYISQTKKETAGIQSRYALEYLRHKFVATVDLGIFEACNFSLFYRFQDRTGTYTDTEGLVHRYKPYGIVDARLSYGYPIDMFEFYIEANNIFNKKYYDFGMIPQPGFWFMAGVKFSL